MCGGGGGILFYRLYMDPHNISFHVSISFLHIHPFHQPVFILFNIFYLSCFMNYKRRFQNAGLFCRSI